ncbi:hypothetical protein VE02_04747 [Pseudogymnoascus sp. 03VT05]|nr:hypothetical protein VE02_04747 [Pseudogymnoascus sp. 03VT05]
MSEPLSPASSVKKRRRPALSFDVSPSSTHLSTTTHPSSYGSSIVEPSESHQEEALRNKDLLDRIRNLEAQLAIAKSEGTTSPQPPIPNAAPKKLRGIISKTRFLGGTHWMYSHGAFDDIAYLFAKTTKHPSGCVDISSEQVGDITEIMQKCKALAKRAKAIPYSQWLANPCFRDVVPEKGIADQLSEEEWDTAPPANIDDIEISEATNDLVTPKPSSTLTQTSLQIMLLKSIGPRLEFIRYSNSILNKPSYDDVLRIGAELTKALRDNRTFILRVNQSIQSQDRVTQFNINMVDHPLRLALLLLHRPFAAKGMKDPRFYYSRKICLESAVTILKYPSSEPLLANQSVDNMFRDDYAQFKVVGGGFKSIITYTSTIIFHELHTQLKEEGPAMVQETKDSRGALKQCLLDLLELSVDRVAMEEINVMVRLLIIITLSLLDATEKGIDPEPVVLEAAKQSSLLCYDLMSTRTAGVNALLPVEAGSQNVLEGFDDPLDFGMDFTMPNFGDQDIQGSWLKFACDDGVLWH